jgi:hypothetical protein
MKDDTKMIPNKVDSKERIVYTLLVGGWLALKARTSLSSRSYPPATEPSNENTS